MIDKLFMYKHIIYLIALTLAICFCFLSYDIKWAKPFYDIALIIIGISIGQFIPIIKEFWLHIITSINGNKDLRATFSYLIRMRIKDQNGITKFLLVKNSKIDGFQPPGGVYKYFDSSALNNLSASDHPLLHKANDLRILIKRKFYPKLFKWFNSGTGRECTPEREFYEELIKTNILDRNVFPFGKFSFLKKYRSPITFSKQLNTDEIKHFDIYDILLSKDQEEYLKLISKTASSLYKFATEEDINRRGFSTKNNIDKFRILEQTTLLIKDRI